MSGRLGVGSWIILIVLLSLLVATGVVIYRGWTLGDGADVPASGYAAMAFGVIISLAVGFGLMALIFYSSRKGYDEPPVLIAPEYDAMESKDVPEAKLHRQSDPITLLFILSQERGDRVGPAQSRPSLKRTTP